MQYVSYSRWHAAFALTVLVSGTAYAAMPLQSCIDNDTCSTMQMIDDAQLAEVAGKFTIAGEVVGMNLSLMSSWQAANGQRLEGNANMSIALPKSGQARAYFDARASVDELSAGADIPATNGVVKQGAGVQNVAGTAQVIQVAGDRNGASNHAEISITTAPVVNAGGNGLLNATYAAANGAAASVHIASNGVSLQLLAPGVGMAQQQINLAQASQLYQGIQIAADGQQVMNRMQLQLQMQSVGNAALAARGLADAIGMLRGR